MTQKEALDILKLGHNVYLTGPAGSGKTYLLKKYISYLRENKIPVGITASTGIAATHMGGITIHSWSGMGIKDEMTQDDIVNLLKKRYLHKHLKKTKVLIIDEVSMLHANQLDLVDRICKVFRGNNNPFGGIQIIMCGDFFQLPPVRKNPKFEIRNSKQTQNINDQNTKLFEHSNFEHSEIVSDFDIHISDLKYDFVYYSFIWNEMSLKVCYLDEQHRQDDRALLSILNDIRNNEVNEMTVEYLSERLDKEVQGYSKPTRLFTHNVDVDAINNKHLAELSGEEHGYLMDWRGNFQIVETLKKNCLAPEKLILKKNAQVMFIKNNFEQGYVNGTLGEVIGFIDNVPKVRTFDGLEITVGKASWEVMEEDTALAAINQVPLRLAWAITVHKSQGMTLDAAEVDLSRSFVPGMGYVALSRVRSLSGLKLMGMNQMALQINPDVVEMDKHFIGLSFEAVQYLNSLDRDKVLKMQQDYLDFMKKA